METHHIAQREINSLIPSILNRVFSGRLGMKSEPQLKTTAIKTATGEVAFAEDVRSNHEQEDVFTK
jgi:hypothetical protein